LRVSGIASFSAAMPFLMEAMLASTSTVTRLS
jgi:hypothetical protein